MNTITVKTVTAHQTQKCMACKSTISIGETFRHLAGTATTANLCPDCYALHSARVPAGTELVEIN